MGLNVLVSVAASRLILCPVQIFVRVREEIEKKETRGMKFVGRFGGNFLILLSLCFSALKAWMNKQGFAMQPLFKTTTHFTSMNKLKVQW